jgi:signal transduction histidine kinase
MTALASERGARVDAISANAIMNVLRAGVIAFDETGTIHACNPFAAELLGTSINHAIGANVSAVLAPVDDLHARTSGDFRGEITVRRSDGDDAVVGYTLSPLPDGRGAAVILFQELTGLQALRRERDRLLQLAAVGEVLPSVLHELRNPIAAITTALEVLIEEAPEELHRDLHGILTEVRRVTLGLQGIGGLGQSAIGARCEAIDEAISEAVNVLQPTAATKGIVLRNESATLPLLPLDRAVLKGIVFNLVRNAIDACGTGCRIAVEGRLVDRAFELSVRDDGRGMPREVLARCTDIFFTTKESGSGIGLAICRQAAERAGGTLSIESESGRGTKVTVRVPVGTQGAVE